MPDAAAVLHCNTIFINTLAARLTLARPAKSRVLLGRLFFSERRSFTDTQKHTCTGKWSECSELMTAGIALEPTQTQSVRPTEVDVLCAGGCVAVRVGRREAGGEQQGGRLCARALASKRARAGDAGRCCSGRSGHIHRASLEGDSPCAEPTPASLPQALLRSLDEPRPGRPAVC